MNDTILKAKNISYSVDKNNSFAGHNSVDILKNISFEVKRGKVLGVSGQSGSGKSTLAKILSSILVQNFRNNRNEFQKRLE